MLASLKKKTQITSLFISHLFLFNKVYVKNVTFNLFSPNIISADNLLMRVFFLFCKLILKYFALI
jgi:hypothetical protein